MKTIDLGDSAHTVSDKGVLNWTAGDYRYAVRLPIRAACVSTNPLKNGRAQLSLGSLEKTNVVLTGPTSTIDALFEQCGGDPLARS